MGLFYKKRLFCGCEFIALSATSDESIIKDIGSISYKWICDKCITLSEEQLDSRLKKESESKICIINGWLFCDPVNYNSIIVRDFNI